ncbi:MAG: hypothetical protein ACKV2Q_31415 [Planctomycetaceae bacterium]
MTLDGSYNNDAQLADTGLGGAAGSATATVNVMTPSAVNTMKGAGTITQLPGAAGKYIDTSKVDDVTYSFGLKYNLKGTSPQGQITISIPQSDGSTIFIKSNSITSVAINATTKTATVYTKANISRNVSDGMGGLSITALESSVTLRMDVKDGGSSAMDQMGFTVISSKTSELYYSNDWIYDTTLKLWKTRLSNMSGGYAVVIG